MTHEVASMDKQMQAEYVSAGIGADQGDSLPAPKPSALAAGTVGPGALAAAETAMEALKSAQDGLPAKVRMALDGNPGAMTMQLARDLGVPEAEVIRALPDNRATELDLGRWEELLRRLESFGTVHVIVSNGAVTLEAVGQFGGFSTWGEFFNVQTNSLDMHVRHGNLGTAFAVEKPSHMSGVNTLSVQFYDQAGAAALKVFLNFGGKAPADTATRFASLREEFRKETD
jgi:putative heme iron utilization protein